MKKIILLLIILVLSVQAVHASGYTGYDIVVTRGDILADSLVAQVYTQNADVPLITVTRGGFSEQAKAELNAYGSQGQKKALIIGGEQAVPVYVENELKSMNYTVDRLWDWNRYGTAGRVAVTLWKRSDSVVVAVDEEGNMVAAAKTAMKENIPLLITEKDKLNPETALAIQKLGASRIVLIGEVSETTKNDLSKLGGVEQTKFTLLNPREPSQHGLFAVGIIVGSLIVFLISSLWGAGLLKKAVGVPYDIFEPDEKEIVDILMKEKRLTQEELSKKTRLSKFKISRLTTELEERGIIDKRRAGKFYIISLRKKIVKQQY